jgi:tetratricopeptide (TPR) repeat protein
VTRTPAIVAGLLMALAAASSAGASVLVLGEGLAPACSKAAFRGKADRASVETCTRALDEALATRDRAGTLVNRGVMLMRGKAYGPAARDFEEAIRLTPELGEAFVNRGVLRMADRDYAGALAEIDRGIQLGVDEPAKAYYNRALAQEGLGDAKAAWLDYRKAQSLDPDWDAPAKQLVRFKVENP